MKKKQILGAIFVFALILGVLIFNYKNNSVNDSNNDSANDITRYLLDNITGKMCCEEIGGSISGKICIFSDLDGTQLEINYRYLQDYNGKNYCTDEYFDRE